MYSKWLYLASLWGILLAGLSPLQAVDAVKPNIIIIFADDLGYGDLGCYGGAEGYATPALDRMAEEGLRLTSFYAADSVCTPSRAGLLTGRYAMRIQGAQGVYFPESKDGLPGKELTLAELLKGSGYATAHIGKWHLGHLPEFLPTEQGFDRYWGIPYSNDMAQDGGMPLAEDVKFFEGMTLEDYKSYQPHNPEKSTREYKEFRNKVPLIAGTEVIEWPVNQRTITRRYTEKSIEFIEQHREQPFFLYLAHTMPHIPLFASEAFKGKTKRGLYGDVIEELDWSVGQILQALRKHELDRNTLVVFTSDNGAWLLFKSHGGSSGPLRDGKGSTYEGGYRVPALFWWPDTIPAGGVSDAMASALDLLPTCATISGAELPVTLELDGLDISEVLLGKTEKSPRNVFVYGKTQAIRVGDWKYRKGKTYGMWAGMPKGTKNPGVEQLFNLKDDIGEQNNLIAQHPEKVARLKEELKRYRADMR